MLDQIQEVVRKNLPAEVGEQLKQFMKEAEARAYDLKTAVKQCDDLAKKLADASAQIINLTSQLNTAGDLAKREKEVTARENKLEVTMAQAEARSAERALNSVQGLVETVFRNPRIVRTHSDEESVPVVVNGYVQSHHKTKTTTDVEETNPKGSL